MLPFPRRAASLLPAGLLLAAPLLAQDASPGDSLLGSFEVPEGLDATLWAESPSLFNPTAMDVDARGRVWVTEAVNYRQWGGRNPGKHFDGGDRVVILEDTDGDGVCDASKVFVQDPDLTAPLGIAVVGDRIYVSCSPNLYVYEDTDGDDIADRREVVLTGFGGFDHDHGLHSVTPHVDGKLYVAVGNAGPHMVTGPDGWSLRSGSLYSGGGPRSVENRPGLVSDDGQVWTGGLVLRMNHDGSDIEVMGHNFRNNYEVAVNAMGELFTADNDDDGNRSCRTTWIMPGGDYGFFSSDGSRSWQADRRPGLTTQEAHWHQGDPGVLPGGTINGGGGPTGVAVYEGELMARWIDGAVLNCDAGARVVYAHQPRAVGAGIELDPGFLIRPRADETGQTGQWFRPSDVAVGPAGEVYVADWYDPGVGGHAARDREAYGRILRIAPAGAEVKTPAVDVSGFPGALAALKSPAPAVRELARAALMMMGEDVVPALVMAAVSRGGDERFAARCAQVLTSMEIEGDLLRLPAPPTGGTANPSIQIPPAGAFMIEAALQQDPQSTAASLLGHGLIEGMEPAVLRRVLQSLRGEALEGPVLELCLEAAVRVDGTDPWLLEALVQVLEEDADLAYAELSASFAETPLAWDARFEALAWRLHPASAVPGLAARAMSPQLDAGARRRALDALAFAPGRAAAEAVAVAAVAGPEDLRGYAGWWVEHRSGNDWRDYGLNISTGTLADAERAWTSEVMGEGVADFDVELDRVSMAWLVVTNGGDGNSCDWAAWIDPRVVMADGREVSLSSGWVEARAEWGSVNSNRDPQGGPLEIGDETFERGIGTHAHSEVAFAIPAGAVRLVGRCGPERGGTDQGIGSSTSVTFEVWLERADEPAAVLDWLAEFMAEDASAEGRAAALQRLARNEQGALLLIQAKRDGQLEPAVVPEVAALLHGSDQLAIRALASEHFERPGMEGATIPSMAALMALEGDASRGREVFLDEERARCVTCHAFQLGDVRVGIDLGPELTQIRKKLTGEALFDAILNPSASIAFGYDTYLLETEDGLLHSGFLLADGATVALLETDGERVTFGRDEIKQRTKQKVSTMPQGLASDLTPQELADLVAFLAEDHETTPELGEPVVLFDGGGLEHWTHHLSDSSVAFEDVWSVQDGVIRCEGRPSGYLKTRESYDSYLLTLEWRFDPSSGPGNSGVLLRMTGEDKVWPRSIEAQLQHRNAGDFWNIDAFGMRTDPARLRGRNTKRRAPSSERPVGEWNRYEILVDGPRVELRVNGVLQNTADWCEEVSGPICLQSEGAVIEFREIQLRPVRR